MFWNAPRKGALQHISGVLQKMFGTLQELFNCPYTSVQEKWSAPKKIWKIWSPPETESVLTRLFSNLSLNKWSAQKKNGALYKNRALQRLV